MLRLDLRGRVALVFQHVEQTGMQRDAFGFEQALVGGVADQGMLEQVGRVGRRAAAEDQFGLHQPVQRVGQLGLGQAGQCGDGR